MFGLDVERMEEQKGRNTACYEVSRALSSVDVMAGACMWGRQSACINKTTEG